MWRATVRSHSRCRLASPPACLPALHGLAPHTKRHIQYLTSNRYTWQAQYLFIVFRVHLQPFTLNIISRGIQCGATTVLNLGSGWVSAVYWRACSPARRPLQGFQGAPV